MVQRQGIHVDLVVSGIDVVEEVMVNMGPDFDFVCKSPHREHLRGGVQHHRGIAHNVIAFHCLVISH